ncbi:hypothetical protein [Nonomuraea aurantiaca]|nr:hypothetical protein [Nonomuraea aurantiaca]MCA2225474.1 hypothetical protein [Nonomuraea aurantiaca]
METDSEGSRERTGPPESLLAFGLVLVGVVLLILTALTTFLMVAGPD